MNRSLTLAAIATVVAIIALALASLSLVGPLVAPESRRAQGVGTTTDLEVVSEKQIGNLVVQRVEYAAKYEGGLQGTLVCTGRIVTNTATDPAKTTATGICNFTGSVLGKQGTLSKIYSLNEEGQGTSRFFAGTGGLQGTCLAGDFTFDWQSGQFPYNYVVTSGQGCKNLPA